MRLAMAIRELDREADTSIYFGPGEDQPRQDGAWSFGPMLAIEPRVVGTGRRKETRQMLEEVERRRQQRQQSQSCRQTGIVLLLGYQSLDPSETTPPGNGESEPPDWLWAEVDGSISWQQGQPRAVGLTTRQQHRIEQAVCHAQQNPNGTVPAPSGRTARTSLPRQAYLDAVRQIQQRITAGDIYQANLCQRFEVRERLDLWHPFVRLQQAPHAPRAVFLQHRDLTLASVSPETFLAISPEGRVVTWPIKGTRRRDSDPEEDARLGRELLASAKDRAELLMIVDLERNDLGRVAETGSVRVGPFPELRRYANVQHLVARVEADLRPSNGLADLLLATFPGGSISGAPKIRAREILGQIEPVARNFFCGSLFWLADDGHVESSILIRSMIGYRDRVWIGAGGGVVTDSEPDAEWQEANDKVRPLCRSLGFEPEDAQ